MGPVVGFDLDMTLIDSRPGIAAVYRELSRRTGVFIDADLVVSRLGPPLEGELANWFPADRVPEMVDLYRALYPELAIPAIELLPGARDALKATRPIVVTAKNAPQARAHFTHFGVEMPTVVGGLWAEGKAVALVEHGAVAYVGDHAGDMRAARTAGVYAIGVTTGPCDADELRAAGADLVLTDLTWLTPEILDSLKTPVTP